MRLAPHTTQEEMVPVVTRTQDIPIPAPVAMSACHRCTSPLTHQTERERESGQHEERERGQHTQRDWTTQRDRERGQHTERQTE